MRDNPTPHGCIDFYGYAGTTGGWLVYGWVPGSATPDRCLPERVVLHFEGGRLEGPALVSPGVRPDLRGLGYGIAVHFPASELPLGPLVSLEIVERGDALHADAAPGLGRMNPGPLIETVRGKIGADANARMERVLAREAYSGRDTLDAYTDRFAFQIDEAIVCAGTDLIVIGWLIGVPGEVRALRVRSGHLATPIDLARCVPVARADVMAKWGDVFRSADLNLGFIAYLRNSYTPDAPFYIELELASGDVAFKRMSPSRLRGLDAIRRVLTLPTPRYAALAPFFERLGEGLSKLSQERLANRPSHREILFGEPPASPRASVIVPVYGNIDYLEVQVALLAASSFRIDHELIYVIDDPCAGDGACHLADSLFQRFGVPIRMILLDENAGFGTASNTGLSVARGSYICFLNSDVFPLQADWLDTLIETLEADPSIGIIGPLLTFEDGTVQHQGLYYEQIPEYDNWVFPFHAGKGRLPQPGPMITTHPAITGACMVLSHRLARELGGFDERYAIGDFEDSDLSLRVRSLDLECAVDRRVSLVHLERKSQDAAAGWRMNVTLYNAWLHRQRWGDALTGQSLQPIDASDPTLDWLGRDLPPEARKDRLAGVGG